MFIWLYNSIVRRVLTSKTAMPTHIPVGGNSAKDGVFSSRTIPNCFGIVFEANIKTTSFHQVNTGMIDFSGIQTDR